MEVCDDGEDDEVGLYGMVWCGMGGFFFLFRFLFFVHWVNGVSWECGNEREREGEEEREKREQAESRHVYFYHQSSIFTSAYP